MGRGREPWERSEAGGVNDNDRHLRHSPVSSPKEELWKDKRKSVDSGRRERTRPGLYLCFVCDSRSVRGCCFIVVCLFVLLNSLNVRRFPPPSSRSTNVVTMILCIALLNMTYTQIEWNR